MCVVVNVSPSVKLDPMAMTIYVIFRFSDISDTIGYDEDDRFNRPWNVKSTFKHG